MNTCPQCGTSNRAEARFCRQCQSALPTAASPTCSHCGTTLRPGVHFCRQCGQPVADDSTTDAHTCPRCGARVREAARFCPSCCASLTTPSGPATGPRCPNCGTPIRAGAHFCQNCSHRLATPPSTPSPPGRFGTGELLPLTILAGRYVIMEKIAQGGMGAVYMAQDKRLQDKIVAVKEMSESIITKTERKRVLESFQREAELLARLAHPNLVRVTDRFQEGEHHYMVMEFIEGQTLEKMLKGRSDPFPEEQVLDWAGQLCDVLFYLHNQEPKIIYRDMKPANVMVLNGSDQVKLIDFGIARLFKTGKQKDTVEFGTDGYAPPEQYGKAQTDERSDIYALGAMLHELLTLREPMTRPFQFPTVSSLNSKVSRRVDIAIAQAVEADRDKRHQSMEEMRSALIEGDTAQKRRPKRKRPSQPAASGRLKLTPDWVNFGEIPAGGNAPALSLSIALPTGEQATLNTEAPWLHINPQKISQQGEQATITLDAAHLKPGRLQLSGGGVKRWIGLHTRLLVPAEQEISTHVEIELQSGYKQRVPVSVIIVPPVQRVQFRWVVTVGLILLEVAVVAIVLGLLVMVILF